MRRYLLDSGIASGYMNRRRGVFERARAEAAGGNIASELREVPPGGTSGSEAGWQQGFDLVAAAWARQDEPRNGLGGQ